MIWKDMNSGVVYRIDEKTGNQIHCNIFGRQIKPVNNKVTGRFNFDGRKAIQLKM